MQIQNFDPASGEIYVIAEVGINHNGDIELAKRLIDVAVDSGCDAVKFQKRNIDIVYTKDFLSSPRESPWGTTQRDQKVGLEFDEEQYSTISAYCLERGIEWTSSAWDIDSLNFVDRFDVPFHKVASAMITNTEFLRAVARKKRFTLISCGMSTWDDIDTAAEIFNYESCDYAFLHTVSSYPAATNELNLLMIKEMQRRYNVPIGYSGHEASVSPSIMAGVLGAAFIERHITIDRSMYGSDQSASLEPAGLRSLVGALRKIKPALGTGERLPNKRELDVAKKLRYWQQ